MFMVFESQPWAENVLSYLYFQSLYVEKHDVFPIWHTSLLRYIQSSVCLRLSLFSQYL